MPSSRESSQSRDWAQVSCIAGGFFSVWATKEAQEYWSGLPCPPPGDLPNPGIFPTQGSNSDLPHCRWILYHLNHQGSPRILELVDYPFSRGTSQPRNRTRVSCIAGRFFQLCWQLMESHGTLLSIFAKGLCLYPTNACNSAMISQMELHLNLLFSQYIHCH